MNPALTTNQRLVTILLVLLIILLTLLVLGIVAGFLMTGGMMGMSGRMLNAMMSACIDMIRNFQNP